MPLYRAHSLRHITATAGRFKNPYIERERRPRDTSIELHQVFGEWFLGKFGIDYRRRALFCTGDVNIAKGYLDGSNALIEILPVGHFSVCFSHNCLDLYGHFQFGERGRREKLNAVVEELERLDFINLHNQGLEDAAESGNEIMLYADIFQYRRLT